MGTRGLIMNIIYDGFRQNTPSWDESFMWMAVLVSKRSKDPSTQNGGVVVNDKNVVIGTGYNGWPRGIEAWEFPWDRDAVDLMNTKYFYVVHAEENAIYNASMSVTGCKIYCTLHPCNECAKTIIQTGIIEVIFEEDRGGSIFDAAKLLFIKAGIKTRQYKRKLSLEEFFK